MTNRMKRYLVLAAAAIAASCTVTSTPAPPLTGPSEMSLSLAIAANPDVLSMDGASQTLITIDARDANGQPAANVPLRLEIIADGQAVDFGLLSARTIVTGANGRASFTYTAPTLVGTSIPDLEIFVTPTGLGDAASHVRRVVNIRLVPPSVINPGGLTASFTFTPDSPPAFTDVLFDASESEAPLGGAIVSYAWTFGDGATGSGRTTTHRFSPGTFAVTLTTTDNFGVTASTSQLITVQPGTPPTAAIVFSPSEPMVGSPVFFNGGSSIADSGRRIVSYRWNFGDGSTGSGITRSHTYTTAGTYVVMLTVTDDAGQVDTETANVTVN